jgi:hypothetical protein
LTAVDGSSSKSLDDELDSSVINTIGVVLDSAASAVKIALDAPCVWSLLLPVVKQCTDTSQPVAAYADGHAWDLLYTMALYTPVASDGSPGLSAMLLDALSWCVGNMVRDYSSLATCVLTASALLHCGDLRRRLEDEQVMLVVGRCRETLGGSSTEVAVCTAYAQLADTLLIYYATSMPAVTHAIMIAVIPPLAQAADVQEDERCVCYAFLLARVAQLALPTLLHNTEIFGLLPEDILERLSLLIDVCSPQYASRMLQLALVTLAQACSSSAAGGTAGGGGGALSEEDRAMVAAAAEGLQEPMEGLAEDGGLTSVADLYSESFDRAGCCSSVRPGGARDALHDRLMNLPAITNVAA